jgi:uncharacterized OsmC-like protein
MARATSRVSDVGLDGVSRGLFSVETRTVAGQVTAVGSAGSFTLVVDQPVEAGGGGKGFNGGQLLYLAIAGCVSNDLFREASRFGVELDSVRVSVEGDFSGDPAVSGPVTYDVELRGSGDLEALARSRSDRQSSELAATGDRRVARRRSHHLALSYSHQRSAGGLDGRTGLRVGLGPIRFTSPTRMYSLLPSDLSLLRTQRAAS